VCGLLVLVLFVAWRRTGYTLAEAVCYALNLFFTRILWRTKVSGPLPVDLGQGAVIVSNHISGIDPLLIQLTTRRKVHWLVAREYVEHWFMGPILKTVGSIPVNRGGIDTASTKLAIRTCQQGGLVGLFPEGRINRTPETEILLPGRPGSAFVALKAKVPVIPCYVSGAPYGGTALSSFFMTARARVVIGQPIDISAYYDRANDRQVQQELTLRFMHEIAALAGQSGFAPKLAGKNWLNGGDEQQKPAQEEPTLDPS
jgi:1-acyl-sn-glycerol-3-phosphate acyltransferase